MAKTKQYPSVEYLKECFDYDEERDTLTWRKRPAEHFDNARNYKHFMSNYFGNEVKSATVSIDKVSYSVSKIIFKIKNEIEPPEILNRKGSITYRPNYKSPFDACFVSSNKKFTKAFKTEAEAQEWLDEMYKKYKSGLLPLVKYKKVPKSGYYGVKKEKHGKFSSAIWYMKIPYFLGMFETAKEASNAYQIAKQQIKDGFFIPPNKVISHTGIKGVYQQESGRFKVRYKNKHIGTFDTAEEAHEAYLKAKNHKTFDDGLDILQKLADEYKDTQ